MNIRFYRINIINYINQNLNLTQIFEEQNNFQNIFMIIIYYLSDLKIYPFHSDNKKAEIQFIILFILKNTGIVTISFSLQKLIIQNPNYRNNIINLIFYFIYYKI